MDKYENLKTVETSGEVSESFRKSFEDALSRAFSEYKESGSFTADSLEDDPMKLAFAKGFLLGCIHADWESRLIFPFRAKVIEDGREVTITGGQINPGGRSWDRFQSDEDDGFRIYRKEQIQIIK